MCLSEIMKELKGLGKFFYISSLPIFKPWNFANSFTGFLPIRIPLISCHFDFELII